MFEVIVFTHCHSCIIAKTPEDGFRKQRSIGDDASQGGHASRRRFSQKEGRNLWNLDQARASDSRFGPRRAVHHLVTTAKCGEEPRVSPDVDLWTIYSSIASTTIDVCHKPVGCSILQGISRRTLLYALHV